jgi:hypothetical protein
MSSPFCFTSNNLLTTLLGVHHQNPKNAFLLVADAVTRLNYNNECRRFTLRILTLLANRRYTLNTIVLVLNELVLVLDRVFGSSTSTSTAYG